MNESVNGSQLDELIKGCIRHDRASQKLLYKQFYGYSMSICMRYTRNREDAYEVLNDAFMKVFTRIEQYDFKYAFKSWLRRILINTSIDCIKKEQKNRNQLGIEDLNLPSHAISQDHKQHHEELLMLVQQLSPAYRSVFNLFVMDGYDHKDIARMLGISVGTSKSNLAKARQRLKELLFKIDKDEYARYAG